MEVINLVNLQAVFDCFDKFEEEFQNGRGKAREKAPKDKNLVTTLQSIHEDEGKGSTRYLLPFYTINYEIGHFNHMILFTYQVFCTFESNMLFCRGFFLFKTLSESYKQRHLTLKPLGFYLLDSGHINFNI